MTNINCSENCIYQQDGKCFLENIEEQKVNFKNTSCAYFVSSDATLNLLSSKSNSLNISN